MNFSLIYLANRFIDSFFLIQPLTPRILEHRYAQGNIEDLCTLKTYFFLQKVENIGKIFQYFDGMTLISQKREACGWRSAIPQ